MPAAWYGTAKRMHAALRINADITGMGKHDTARANRGKCFAIFYNTRSYSCRRVVPGAADDNCIRRKTRLGCKLFGNRPGYFRRFIYLRKKGRIDIQSIQDFLGPAAMRHIQKLHAAGIRYFRRIFTSHAKPNVILGKQNMAAAAVIFRFMVAHP